MKGAAPPPLSRRPCAPPQPAALTVQTIGKASCNSRLELNSRALTGQRSEGVSPEGIGGAVESDARLRVRSMNCFHRDPLMAALTSRRRVSRVRVNNRTGCATCKAQNAPTVLPVECMIITLLAQKSTSRCARREFEQKADTSGQGRTDRRWRNSASPAPTRAPGRELLFQGGAEVAAFHWPSIFLKSEVGVSTEILRHQASHL